MAKFITAAGFGNQPNAFPSAEVETQVAQVAPSQPVVNLPMGWSTTWAGIYQAAESGQAIAVPYHDVKVTDPDRLPAMTEAYAASRNGAPLTVDIREVLLPAGLIDMGFVPRAGLDGRTLLAQQCAQCHNSRLDPTLSRDRFLVDKLDQMSRSEKDLAIARIQLGTDTRLTMPPPLFRLPNDSDRALMIEELKK
jgi:hypothetical protein